MIPVDLEESFFLNLYKGKGEALDHGNYHGLKLTEQAMKLLEQVLDFSICQMVNIDEKHFTIVPGRGTTYAIFTGIGVHQGFVLSPLLFILELEVPSRKLCSDVPWEPLLADDLVLIARSGHGRPEWR